MQHGTDLNCLNILSCSGQLTIGELTIGELTVGELATATGLTTASIAGAVDRLEQAGLRPARAGRDAQDRRREVIHLDVHRTLGTVFGPLTGAWQRRAGQYADDDVRLIVEFCT